MEATLIFPHQLYAEHPALDKRREIILYEDPLFFTQYNFHKKKLLLHRASMKCYAGRLQRSGYTVSYKSVQDIPSLKALFDELSRGQVSVVHYCDPTDYLLERRLCRYAGKAGIKLVKCTTPNFLLTSDEFRTLVPSDGKYFMASFYVRQRKKLDILVEPSGLPTGGKWSFDEENRKRLPKGFIAPQLLHPQSNAFVSEAKEHVQKFYRENYGDVENFHFAVSHEDAEQMLENFLLNRLRFFGDYEDAIVASQSTLFHSVLTPYLNIGLLTPEQIINRTFQLHEREKFPLNSLEGFLRQIIGWREFMRGLYVERGVYMRTRNYLGFQRSIPSSFWNGETGIVPVDMTIKKVLQHAYCHHIERLMILGNFMQLCLFHPDDVYRWFMELFIDAYDWVMVSNVYGMSQYAGGPIMTTKPYVSGSNYVLKMSDFKKGEWCEVWDSLYWVYLHTHRDFFNTNPRMKIVYNLLDKMPRKKLDNHVITAENFLCSIN
jgi:deoxyribodipyrimidine photolyase-related protein